MKTIFSVLIIMVFFIQDISSQSDLQLNNFYQEYLTARRRDQSYFNHISGSPYENNLFSEALVYFRDNPVPASGELRYNDLFDEMEMLEEGSDEYLILDKKETIDSIHLNLTGETYRYLIYNNKGKLDRGYFIKLFEGECNLFLKRTREYQPERKAAGYQDYVPPAIIKKSDMFFVKFGDNPLELIPQSTRNMVDLFKTNGYDINDFVKKNKVRYNKESLLGVFKYCNP